TLAKLANHIAKKFLQLDGVCDLSSMSALEQDIWCKRIEVGEIWGIGRRLAPKLQQYGIQTVYDLKCASPIIMRNKFSVVMEKIIRELNGISCIELEEVAQPKKEIVCSRSFGVRVTQLSELEEAVSLYMRRAAEKLRRQHSYAGVVSVFINTSRFNKPQDNYWNETTIPLPTHADSTILLTKTALWGLRRIYRWGFEYQKAGVRLSGLVNAQTKQADLFGLLPKGYTSQELIAVMDKINNRMGGGTIRLTSEGIQQNWMMKRERISQEFTTDWDELLSVV
ncbi:MAG TPA: DUF4113 domain-containing protein, partial [Nitrosomonas sp.]|nr:DUF4113 domain-containing protein [Nitrosomonas sp.]